MKKLKYIVGLIFVFTGLNLVGQDVIESLVKVEKRHDPVVVPPPAENINSTPITDTPVINNDRLVFWVHGLGGDVYSWDKVSFYTYQNYKISSKQNNLNYGDFFLDGAAYALSENIEPIANDGVNPDPSNNFIIAHSQGGLVSRAAYKNYNEFGSNYPHNGYGGIVTFGTPHQGAKVLNNVPQFLDFVEGSCNTLSAGPALEAWNGNWILAFIPADGMINALGTICNTFSQKVVPFMIDDYLAPITDDYKVGSDYLVELNQFDEDMVNNEAVNIPKVAYFGVEEAPVVWRTVYSLLNDVNEEPAFGANQDSELIGIANENQNRYYSKYMGYQALYDGITNNFVSNILFWWLADNYHEMRNAYRAGYHWWLNVDESYLSLIGAVDYEIDECHCDCLEKYPPDPTPFNVTHIIDCDDNCDYFEDNPPPNTHIISCEYAVVYEKYIKQNDGIVLVESAQDYPGADNGNDNKMDNTNHLQMRNNSQTKVKLESLTIGDDGAFFITEERN